MDSKKIPYWLELAREIQALGQTGLAFNKDEYNIQRYQRLMKIAAEIMGQYTILEKEELFQNFFAQPGYATPKIDVRGAIFQDNKILLVQERTDLCWAMPGGWADVGEKPSAMVEREVREESGFLVKAKKIIAVYDANRDGRPIQFYHAYKIIFLCEIYGGDATPSDETLAVDFFSLDNLPPLSTSRTNLRHLTEVFEHFQNPERLAAFD